ncbi:MULTISPECIES: APC family permease [unclassified Streptomyces]|uniref:APC family permease n=1 Tax=unclassified Streptomyces TaxID=2593676 RepID=UPI0035DA317D
MESASTPQLVLPEPDGNINSERRKLKKSLGRFDILFFLLCTIVGLDTVGTVASHGPEAFTWMIVLAVIFFVPSAFLCAELGAAFPQEGGPYLWARLAFGHLAGSFTAVLYWITTPVWIGGTLSVAALTSFATFFGDGDLPTGLVFYGATAAFIWLGVLTAVLSFRIGKWVPIIGGWARLVLLALFSLTVVVYAVEHGLNGFGAGAFAPSWAGFVGLIPVLMFNYVGFELPSSAGEEMRDPQKDVPFAIFRSAVLSVLLYSVPVLGILLVLPVDAVTGLSGFLDAVRQVFTVYGGQVQADGTVELAGAGLVLGGACAVAFALTLFSSAAAWLMGSDRALAVAGYDGSVPRSLGVLSERFGTPVRVNVLSGVVATGVLVLTHELTGGNTAKYFGAVLSLALSTTLISYLFIFPALPALRSKFPLVERPYRAPWPRVTGTVLTLLIAFATLQLVAPGLGADWFGADFAPSGWEHGERWAYLATQGIPLIAIALLAVVFWAFAARTRRAAGGS